MTNLTLTDTTFKIGKKYTKNNFNFSTDFKYNENTYLKSKKIQ